MHFLLPVPEGQTPSAKLTEEPNFTFTITDDIEVTYDTDVYEEEEDDYEYDSDDDDEDSDESDYDCDAYDYDYEEFLVNHKAEQAELVSEMLPKTVQVESHHHELTLESSVYAGEYTCDICAKNGRGWVYHCEHSYDVHPQCALDNFDEYVEKAIEGYNEDSEEDGNYSDKGGNNNDEEGGDNPDQKGGDNHDEDDE